MAENALNAVQAEVRAYVDRGVLRQFSEKQGRAGWHEWEFVWLTPRPFVLRYDPSPPTLTFKALLPKIGRASSLVADVEALLAGRSARALPAHRRVDPSRATIGWVKQRGQLSLVTKVKRREYKYAVGKAFNLVNEIFVLLRRSHSAYLEDHFGVSRE